MFAGVPVVYCDYLVNRPFEERHGQLMWLVPIRPEPMRLAAAIVEAFEVRTDPRIRRARDIAMREYFTLIMGRRIGWSGPSIVAP